MPKIVSLTIFFTTFGAIWLQTGLGPAGAETHKDSSQIKGVKYNRLINETSPYLLQHATNPVDWYPWGEAAFEKAKKENKPIFLSIGYATCHWCHVMERESIAERKTGLGGHLLSETKPPGPHRFIGASAEGGRALADGARKYCQKCRSDYPPYRLQERDRS